MLCEMPRSFKPLSMTAAIDDQAWFAETRAAILTTRGRLSTQLKEIGFDVVDSQANFVWCTHPDLPVEQIYRELKQAGILVRYMLYAGWGDGLRITVGTDEQVDACLAHMRPLV